MTQNILSAYPDRNDIYAASRRGGEGAGEAVAADLQGKVRVVSFDVADPEISDMKNGIVDVLVVQTLLKMGYAPESHGRADAQLHAKASNEDTGVTLVRGKNINDSATRAVLNPSCANAPV